jgi:hypothetical protein
MDPTQRTTIPVIANSLAETCISSGNIHRKTIYRWVPLSEITWWDSVPAIVSNVRYAL